MKRNLTGMVAAVALLFSIVPAAKAADNLNLSEQRFAPSPHAGDFITVMSSRVRHTWDWDAGVFFNWSAETMRFKDAAGIEDTLVEGRLTADIIASMSFFDYVSLGIDFPLNVYTMAGDAATGFSGGALDRGDVETFSWGDLRISTKVRILDAVESIIGVAIAADVTVPTGKKDALATNDGVTVLPRLIIDMNYEGWRAALNVGYKWRDDYSLRWLDVGPEFFIGAAVSAPIIEYNLDIIGELEVSTNTAAFFTEGNADFLEGRLALQYKTDAGLGITLGGGAGFLTAWGSPLYRVFAGLNYAPRHVSRDLDGDGIEDDVDQCPTEAEDKDGFQDSDGCPDLDNDADGIADADDQCPMDAEDKDGFEDVNGCPDPDNDGDAILDVSDGCPNEAEDKDGFQDDDGCPDPDNDGDGIADVNDQCPMEAEDVDGCKDSDGCPEPGNVCVTEKEIKILQKVYFKTGRATIKPESYPILDEIAQVLQDHPELLRIEIQGHTDSKGNDRRNMRLSTRRAKAVAKYLTKAGVAKKRLYAKGYGETTPIATNDTDEGRARNRRVEFHITEKATKQ